MAQNTEIKASNIALPKGGGAIKGIGESFQPNSFSGTAGLTIPIPTTPCRGTEPEINIQYNSAGGNGVFGLGFSLSLPNIARKTSKRRPQYTDDDVFLFSNAEDLVPSLAQNTSGDWQPVERNSDDGHYIVREYRPRVEGLFARIEKWTNVDNSDSYWVVITAENQTNTYGKTEQARITDPQDTSKIYQWLLEESRDALGNRQVYEYKAEDRENIPNDTNGAGRESCANKYLYKIKYGNHQNSANQQSWHFEVVFDYGERDLSDPNNIPYEPSVSWPARQDPFSDFIAGFELRPHRLCRAVLVFHLFEHEFDGAPIAVRATTFDYEENAILSTMVRTTSMGYRHHSDGTVNRKALPPLDLRYSKSDPRWLFNLHSDFQQAFVAGPISSALAAELRLQGLRVSDRAEVIAVDDSTWHIEDSFNPEQTNPSQVRSPRTYIATLAANSIPILDPARQPQLTKMHVEGQSVPPSYFDGSPTNSGGGGFQLQDLYGEGLAGILYCDDTHAMYWQPKGKGCYAPGKVIADFPSSRNLQHPLRHLESLNGDGVLDLVSSEPQRSEYYSLSREGRWHNYQPLPNIPLELFEPAHQCVDVNGSGLADALIIDDNKVRTYLSRGKNGYQQAIMAPKPASLPITTNPSEVEVVRFANILGDGLQHEVRIRNGCVECWPNLGYGLFGEAITLNNAPHFGSDFDEKRLYLADIDGSGSADIIYAHSDHLEIFYNQSGNGFSSAHCFPLAKPYNNQVHLSFSDIQGSGTSALVMTYLTPQLEIEHYYYDFCNGQKPYLLVHQNNNMGSTTQTHYLPSTEYYLADRDGNPSPNQHQQGTANQGNYLAK